MGCSISVIKAFSKLVQHFQLFSRKLVWGSQRNKCWALMIIAARCVFRDVFPGDGIPLSQERAVWNVDSIPLIQDGIYLHFCLTALTSHSSNNTNHCRITALAQTDAHINMEIYVNSVSCFRTTSVWKSWCRGVSPKDPVAGYFAATEHTTHNYCLDVMHIIKMNIEMKEVHFNQVPLR